MDPLIAEIRMFAGNFAPQGWMFCHGQTLQISQYQALYSILSIKYGGDGSATFCLPDLRGRVPVDVNAGNRNVALGRRGGTASSGPFQSDTERDYHQNTQYCTLSYIIAVEGIYPSRS